MANELDEIIVSDDCKKLIELSFINAFKIIAENKEFIPHIALFANGEQEIKTLTDDEYQVEALANSIINDKEKSIDAYAIAYRSYIQLTNDSNRQDAILVEAAEKNSEKGVIFAQLTDCIESDEKLQNTQPPKLVHHPNSRFTNDQVVNNETSNDSIIKDVANKISLTLNDLGYSADFSIESLKEIDRFFDDNTDNGTPKPDSILSEMLGETIIGIGLYVGEVLVKKYRGEWMLKGGIDLGLGLKINDDVEVHPIQKVLKRFQNGSEDSLSFFNEGIEMQV